MLRFIDHDFRFIIDKFINGFPTKLIHEWSAWGINAGTGYISCSSDLKFLQMIYSSKTTAIPNWTTASKMRFNNTKV